MKIQAAQIEFSVSLSFWSAFDALVQLLGSCAGIIHDYNPGTDRNQVVVYDTKLDEQQRQQLCDKIRNAALGEVHEFEFA